MTNPGDIYNRFLDQQLQRRIQGEQSYHDDDDEEEDIEDLAGDSSEGFSPNVNLAEMSRLRVQECSEDDDDDDVEVLQSQAATSATTPHRSSMKKAGTPSKSSHVRFNEEPSVKEFKKTDTPGPKVRGEFEICTGMS